MPWSISPPELWRRSWTSKTLLKNIDAFMRASTTSKPKSRAKNAELEKVTANRDAILKEKRALEGRDFDPDAFQKKLEAQFNRNTAEVTISREKRGSAPSTARREPRPRRPVFRSA